MRWLLLAFVSITASVSCGRTTEPIGTAAPPSPTSTRPDAQPGTKPATSTTPSRIDYPRTVRIEYGDGPQQFADLTLPSEQPAPVVVLIHGGFWRAPYDLTLMEPLAADLVERGYAVWNLEYRRIGDVGGGWPGTLLDVAAGIDALAASAGMHPVDLDRVAVVGHSAGGHLALWAAGRAALPDEAPGSRPSLVPALAVGQGAVVDLTTGAATGLGDGAVVELLGGLPAEQHDRYVWATPRLDTGPRMVSVVGTADTIVPPSFSADPEQPDGVTVIEIDGADHFDLIAPSHPAWLAVVDQLDAELD